MKRSGGRKRPGEHVFALAVLALFAVAAWWAVTTLFAKELHETGQWVHAKYEALRR